MSRYNTNSATRCTNISESVELIQIMAEAKTFRDLYCEEHKLVPKKFERAIFLRSLHLNGILCYPLIQIFFPPYFRMDREFIRRLGSSRNLNEAKTVYNEFASFPYNESFSRRVLCIRISKHHALDIAAHAFPSKPTVNLQKRVQKQKDEEDAGEIPGGR